MPFRESFTLENADDIIELFMDEEEYGFLNLLNFVRYRLACDAWVEVNMGTAPDAAMPYLKAAAILDKAMIELLQIDWSAAFCRS